MALTHKNVTDILRIVDESDIEELVLDIDGAKLVIRRGAAAAAAAVQPVAPPAAPPVIAAPETGPPPVRQRLDANDKISRSARSDGKVDVRAPMVGTFYRRPSPQEPVFVEVGSRVRKGDPLCLIEVMKLYTTIESPCDGTVREIGAENAALVEHDAVLFVIEPS